MNDQPVEYIMHDRLRELTEKARNGGTGGKPALQMVPGEVLGQDTETTRIVVQEAGLGQPEVVVVERRPLDDRRPALDVTVKANTLDWVRENLGRENLPGYYVRDGVLVRVPRTGTEIDDGHEVFELSEAEKKELVEKEGPAQVKVMRAGSLVAHIQEVLWPFVEKRDVEGPKGSRVAERITKYRTHEVLPQAICQPVIDGAPTWRNVPRITAVSHTPMLRHDGTMIMNRGYDERSGVLYLPSEDLRLRIFPEPGNIREDWVEWAVARIEEVFVDFPFESPTHRSNLYAMLLTPLMRRVVSPPYPMWLLNAHQRGTGKSLLAKVAGTLHGIVHRPDLSPDDEEIRKSITSVLMTTTAPLVNFDNITAPIKSGQLANLLTSKVWTDRKLGGNETAELTNDRIWLATGNNIRIGGDLARRVLWIQLDAAVARPELRTDFRELNLLGYVERERGELLSALLVVLGWWVQRGMPRATLTRTDDYSDWTSAMMEILGGVGLGDGFGDMTVGMIDPVMSDDEAELGTFIEALKTVFGIGTPFQVRDIRHAHSGMSAGGPATAAVLEDAMPSVFATAYKDPWKALGHYLAKHEKQFVDDTRVVKMGDKARVAVYKLEQSLV